MSNTDIKLASKIQGHEIVERGQKQEIEFFFFKLYDRTSVDRTVDRHA